MSLWIGEYVNASHRSPEFLRNENIEIVYCLDMHLFIRHNSALFYMHFTGFKLRLEQCNNIIENGDSVLSVRFFCEKPFGFQLRGYRFDKVSLLTDD